MLDLSDVHPAEASGAPSLVQRAFAFAAERHVGQRRKDGALFITHPVRVARLLQRRGYSEEVIAAALLHDVVEDTDTTIEEIRERFGERVADLVAAVTEDLTLPYDERKRAYREGVERACPEARAICAADKVANVTDLHAAATDGDREVLARFRGGLPSQVERFTAELKMLDRVHADDVLCDNIRHELDALRSEARRLAGDRLACLDAADRLDEALRRHPILAA